jgi:hypothetical protein
MTLLVPQRLDRIQPRGLDGRQQPRQQPAHINETASAVVPAPQRF